MLPPSTAPPITNKLAARLTSESFSLAALHCESRSGVASPASLEPPGAEARGRQLCSCPALLFKQWRGGQGITAGEEGGGGNGGSLEEDWKWGSEKSRLAQKQANVLITLGAFPAV